MLHLEALPVRLLAVAPPAGDKGNHTAFIVLISLIIVAFVILIGWAWNRRRG